MEHHGVAQPGADRAAQAHEQDPDRIGTGQRGRREGTLVAGSEDLVAGHPGVSDDDAEAGDGTRDANQPVGPVALVDNGELQCSLITGLVHGVPRDGSVEPQRRIADDDIATQ